eukprot:TRINITY_DN4689_c0_g1_i1.p2 TRINITY_DN4689_c0_g1~~TRINITY_DN4689_c0_g1_i1.p2  ORF type:complete len:127 (+),score=12.99 TRINITY_DN4689_c0_g1_i1:604-984(+)
MELGHEELGREHGLWRVLERSQSAAGGREHQMPGHSWRCRVCCSCSCTRPKERVTVLLTAQSVRHEIQKRIPVLCVDTCLLYTSDAADEEDSVDLGGRRIIKKKKKKIKKTKMVRKKKRKEEVYRQ